MMRIWILLISLSFLTSFVSQTQDAFELPAELYILSDEGVITRFGLGLSGINDITSEDETVIDFGVAPDGIGIAYRTPDGLFLRNMLSDNVTQLEAESAGFPPFRGDGVTMAWSPDSGVLAYTVDYGLRFYFDGGVFFDFRTTPIIDLLWSEDGRYLAAQAQEDVWWIYRRDANQMLLHAALPVSDGIVWVEQGILMFMPDTGGLFLMDLDNVNAQAQIASDDLVYRKPVKVEQRLIRLFAKAPDDTELLETAGYLYEASFTDSWNVQQISESAVDVARLRWMPEGQGLSVFDNGQLTLVDPITAEGQPLPVENVVVYRWGEPLAVSNDALVASAPLYFLSDDFIGGDQIWMLATDGSPPMPITAVETGVDAFAVAADGETIAYFTNGGLYLLPAGVDTAQLLTEVDAVDSMTFDAGITRLFYSADDMIYQIALEDGEISTLLTGYYEPEVFVTDLVVRIAIDDDFGIYQPDGSLIRLGGFDQVYRLSDGRYLGAGAPVDDGIQGLYLLSSDGSAPPLLNYQIFEGQRIADIVELAPDLVRLVLVEQDGFPARSIVVDVAINSGQPLSLIDAGYAASPLLSPDGQLLLGYANASGLLILKSIDTEEQRLFTMLSSASDFQWLLLR